MKLKSWIRWKIYLYRQVFPKDLNEGDKCDLWLIKSSEVERNNDLNEWYFIKDTKEI